MLANLYKDSEILHIEHLLNQRDHLALVRERHLRWLDETSDTKVGSMHREIADLLERLLSQYEGLVDILERQIDLG